MMNRKKLPDLSDLVAVPFSNIHLGKELYAVFYPNKHRSWVSLPGKDDDLVADMYEFEDLAEAVSFVARSVRIAEDSVWAAVADAVWEREVEIEAVRTDTEKPAPEKPAPETPEADPGRNKPAGGRKSGAEPPAEPTP